MPTVTLDAAACTVLRGQTQPVIVQDESGTVLGQFVPRPAGKPYTPPPLSEEEYQRRMNEPSYSTAEVLAMLEKLDVHD